jgi:hypothetical protein
MTAYEAFKAAKERRQKIAKEFITNVAYEAIQESIDKGLFSTSVAILDDQVLTAIEDVLSELKDLGFQVEFTEAVLGNPGYLDITYDVGED